MPLLRYLLIVSKSKLDENWRPPFDTLRALVDIGSYRSYRAYRARIALVSSRAWIRVGFISGDTSARSPPSPLSGSLVSSVFLFLSFFSVISLLSCAGRARLVLILRAVVSIYPSREIRCVISRDRAALLNVSPARWNNIAPLRFSRMSLVWTAARERYSGAALYIVNLVAGPIV